MSTDFVSESHGTIAPGEVFAEIGTMSHDGTDFAAGGAYITDDRMVAYLGSIDTVIPHGEGVAIDRRPSKGDGNVQTWQGINIGRYSIVKSWRVHSMHGTHDMNQVSIRLTDGRRYNGRSQGPNMIVTARRLAADRRSS